MRFANNVNERVRQVCIRRLLLKKKNHSLTKRFFSIKEHLFSARFIVSIFFIDIFL